MTNTVNVTKLNTYAVEQISYDRIYQDTDADRPVYREAPSGGVPYVDMSATGASLKVNIPEADTFTFIVYKADQTFEVYESDLVEGENTLPVTEDFNQVVMLKGRDLNYKTIESVKEGMKARV